MDMTTFFNLRDWEIANLIAHAQPRTCVVAINGTQRWFILNRRLIPGQDAQAGYLDAVHSASRQLIDLLLDHGLSTLVLPVFGQDLLRRGLDYVREAMRGLMDLAGADWMRFYRAHGIQVRFYGDWRNVGDADLVERLEAVEQATLTHKAGLMAWGICADRADLEIVRLAVDWANAHGCVPDHDTLVQLYYGERLPPARLFIGFGQPCAFDFPLLDDGQCDLYFTAAPTLYLDRNSLRSILYDHLYARPERRDYGQLTAEEWETIGRYYRLNRGEIAGVGQVGPGRLWFQRGWLPDGWVR